MSKLGFYFDAESCIGCHTCEIACKDAHDLPVGTNYRKVRSFCCGEDYKPRIYHLSMSLSGCDTCADLREIGEGAACVAACPQRALEFGDIDEIRSRHEARGESIANGCLAWPSDELANPNLVMRVKDCMDDPDFDEYII